MSVNGDASLSEITIKVEPSSSTMNSESVVDVELPCLRGVLGADHVCSGVWGMSEAAHRTAGQTSDFEFRLVQPHNSPDSSTTTYPCKGQYQGWFKLQSMSATGKLSHVKIDEKDMSIEFSAATTASGEVKYVVSGAGVNKFGSFNLKGELYEDKSICLYKSYTTEPAVVVKKEKVAASPRESVNRIRKASVHLIDMSDVGGSPYGSSNTSVSRSRSKCTTPRTAKTTTEEVHGRRESGSHSRASSGSAGAGKSGRGKHAAVAASQLTSQGSAPVVGNVLKCRELVRDLSSQPQHSHWFVQPVDYIALGLADYCTVITRPIDLGTIQRKLEAEEYTTFEQCLEDIRLVFANAILYNQSPASVVRSSAFKLSARLEDKVRSYQKQLQTHDRDMSDKGLSKKADGINVPKGVRPVVKVLGPNNVTSYLPMQVTGHEVLFTVLDERVSQMDKHLNKVFASFTTPAPVSKSPRDRADEKGTSVAVAVGSGLSSVAGNVGSEMNVVIQDKVGSPSKRVKGLGSSQRQDGHIHPVGVGPPAVCLS